jgi:hypothetical protein
MKHERSLEEGLGVRADRASAMDRTTVGPQSCVTETSFSVADPPFTVAS